MSTGLNMRLGVIVGELWPRPIWPGVVIEEDDQSGSALAQIKAQDYAARLQGEYRQIHLVGIEFSKAQRNIVNFESRRTTR